MKCCPTCGIEYPTTKEYFYSDKRYSDGLTVSCKNCVRLRNRKMTAQYRSKQHAFDPKRLKRCPQCQQQFPATPDFFYRCRTKADGLHHYCIHCHKIRLKSERKRHYAKYKDEELQRARLYRKTHQEQIRVSRWLHYQKNKSLYKRAKRRFYLKHRERILQQQKTSRIRNMLRKSGVKLSRNSGEIA